MKNSEVIKEEEDLTAGMINKEYVSIFYAALVDSDGNVSVALQQAYDDEDLNVGSSTEENDSWYEAKARYDANF